MSPGNPWGNGKGPGLMDVREVPDWIRWATHGVILKRRLYKTLCPVYLKSSQTRLNRMRFSDTDWATMLVVAVVKKI